MATGRVPTTANSPLTAKGDLFGYSTTQARVPVGNDGEQIVADSSTSTGLRYQSNFAAGKNKIINGAFDIWQRGTTTSTNAAYICDRFKTGFTGTGTTQTMERQSFTPGTAPVAGYEATYFVRNIVVGGTGTSSLVVMQQPVEDVRTFAGQTVTLSFYAKATSGTPSIGLDLFQEFGSGGSSTVSNGGTKVAITTSWARYSATIALASISGKTIGTSSLLGVRFWFSSGSDYNSLNGTLGLQSNTFDIWGVQLEAGSVATAFQTATGTLQGELAACQRYYWRTTATGTIALGSGTTEDANRGIIFINNPVPMRVAPTSVDSATLTVTDMTSYTLDVTSVTGIVFGTNGGRVTFNTAGGQTTNRASLGQTKSTGGHIGSKNCY
jgi:hypothetical protein